VTESGRAAPEGPFFLGYKEEGLEEEFQIFKDYGQALTYMETPEVEEGCYRLFDSAAREALLGAQKWDVIVKGWSEPRSDAMRSGISAFLRRKGYPPADEEPDVRAFVARVAPILEKIEDEDTPALIRAIRGAFDRIKGKGG
jgi:hypothetical protein